jgi:peptidyl-prolyl cis-trans isomerase A (cyclophilin A)
MRFVSAAFGLIAGLAGIHGTQAPAPVVVVLETDRGVIEVAVDVARAPVTSANFLQYVDAGLYDGGAFHRAVRPETETRADFPIQVVQARRARGSRGYPAIALERTRDTGLAHKDGFVSMARVAGRPDSAASDFFICIGDQPSLDFGGKRNDDGQGFAAFGRVVAGMDVVRAIHAAPVRNGSQSLMPAVSIVKVRRK